MLFTQSSLFTAAQMVHSKLGVLLIFHTRMPPSPVEGDNQIRDQGQAIGTRGRLGTSMRLGLGSD